MVAPSREEAPLAAANELGLPSPGAMPHGHPTETPPWLLVVEPKQPGQPRIAPRRAGIGGGFEALFQLELASVAEPTPAEPGRPPDEWTRGMVRDRYFQSLFSRLKPGESVTFLHASHRDRMGDIVFESRIVGAGAAATAEELFFRIGTRDAPVIEPFVLPHLSARELVSLPDHYVASRLLADNVPTPPFVFRTRAPLLPERAAAQAIADAVVAACRQRYTRPVEAVEREIEWRRTSYPALRSTRAAHGPD